jgi:hypothetical protein
MSWKVQVGAAKKGRERRARGPEREHGKDERALNGRVS